MSGRLGGGHRPPGTIEFRGTVLGTAVLRRIRGVVRSGRLSGVTRDEIGRRLCQLFDWRRPNGELAVRACTALLRRLEGKGLITLPRHARASNGRAHRVPVAPVEVDAAMFEAPPSAGLFVRRVLGSEKRTFRGLMARHHYLGDAVPPGETVYQIAFFDQRAVALLCWASPTLHNAARDAWIGWDARTRARRLHLVCTNVRFLMLPESGGAVRNLASQVLSAGLRRVSGDFEALYGHPALVAETFVDLSRFQGTCYRASNWIFVGETSGWSRRGTVWWKHGCRKGVFVFALHRRAREWLTAEESPVDSFRQDTGGMKLDIEKLPIEGKGGLLDVLGTITDPRGRRGRRYSLLGLLAMGVAAILAGARSIVAIAQHVEEMDGELRRRLGGDFWRAPDESTFRKVFARVDAAELDRNLGRWMARHVDVIGQGVALDGKTVRGSRDGNRPAIHLVSAVVHRDGSVLSQTRVSEKTNEITSVQPVLHGMEIAGAVITGDAMFAQTEVARHIVEDKKAEYLFTVKDNQPTLRATIDEMRLESFFPSVRDHVSGARAGGNPTDLGHRPDRSPEGPDVPPCPAGLPDRDDGEQARRDVSPERNPARRHEPLETKGIAKEAP